MPLAFALRHFGRRAGAAALLGLASLAVAGCGGGGDPIQAQTGPQIFDSANCASCHTLAAEDASGTIGPNLDERKPGADRVAEFVRTGAAGMPSFKSRLTPEQIDTLAAYVAEAAGSH